MPHPPAPFVIGASRSGTTLLRVMLDSHPELAIPAEVTFFQPAASLWDRCTEPVDAFLESVVATRNWRHLGIEREELALRLSHPGVTSAGDALRVFYLLCAEKQGKPRWGDKNPLYTRLVRLIAEHLPEARFVHMIRDGRDVALSHRGLTFGPQTIEEAAPWWSAQVRAARSAAAALAPASYLEVRYENLVEDPEPQLRRICELIELRWNDRMLTYHERSAARLVEQDEEALARITQDGAARERIIAVRGRLRGPLDSSRVARWRTEMDRAEVERFVALAGDLLADLGYDLS
jgi:hypothetical protein